MKSSSTSIPLSIPGLIQDQPKPKTVLATFPSIGVMSELMEAFSKATNDTVVSPRLNSLNTLNLGYWSSGSSGG